VEGAHSARRAKHSLFSEIRQARRAKIFRVTEFLNCRIVHSLRPNGEGRIAIVTIRWPDGGGRGQHWRETGPRGARPDDRLREAIQNLSGDPFLNCFVARAPRDDDVERVCVPSTACVRGLNATSLAQQRQGVAARPARESLDDEAAVTFSRPKNCTLPAPLPPFR